MIRARSIRHRMMLLFCAVVGALLALSYAGFYLMFQHVVSDQLDRRLRETAAPIIADLMIDPEERDVDALDITDEYFEVLNSSGQVLQRSKNLENSLPLSMDWISPKDPVYRTVQTQQEGEIRVAVIPFLLNGETNFFAVSTSTREAVLAMDRLRSFAFILFPASLLLTAAISRVYANRSLRPAMEQLRQFVSDASHELRTPLSVLRGETELLLARQRSTAEYESAVRIIDAELKKLSHIVDGLFTLSMADAGQLRLAAEPLYLEEVLEETCAMAAPAARQKQIRIEKDLQRDVCYSGDAAFLRQLFLIFIDNALKYSPSGTRVRVKLSAERDVLIRFQDEGIGIAHDNIPRIFERFFRVAQNGSGETQSGGLGLAIAQAIVQAHQGTIECESEPGAGSVFTIRLPLASSAST